jgi:beta-glucanase (GH16 family)
LGLVVLAALTAAGLAPAASDTGAQEPILSRTPDGRPIRLTFNEDFQAFSAGPQGRRWRTVYGDGTYTGLDKRTLASNGELQAYVDRSLAPRGADAAAFDPFVVRGGMLNIVANPTPAGLHAKLGGLSYTSGLITSQPSFAQRYGYFEVNARLPEGRGMWPALWMLPADQTWPPEIDIMESIGDPRTAYASIHSANAPAFTQSVSLARGGFHTFAVSWDAQRIEWFVDGAKVATRPTPADMNKPMFLLANLAVGGAWPGAPDASTRFPAVFSIRYIRAYQFHEPRGPGAP